jgi:hypothetical protein
VLPHVAYPLSPAHQGCKRPLALVTAENAGTFSAALVGFDVNRFSAISSLQRAPHEYGKATFVRLKPINWLLSI